jgi:hypothetical protein
MEGESSLLPATMSVRIYTVKPSEEACIANVPWPGPGHSQEMPVNPPLGTSWCASVFDRCTPSDCAPGMPSRPISVTDDPRPITREVDRLRFVGGSADGETLGYVSPGIVCRHLLTCRAALIARPRRGRSCSGCYGRCDCNPSDGHGHESSHQAGGRHVQTIFSTPHVRDTLAPPLDVLGEWPCHAATEK